MRRAERTGGEKRVNVLNVNKQGKKVREENRMGRGKWPRRMLVQGVNPDTDD